MCKTGFPCKSCAGACITASFKHVLTVIQRDHILVSTELLHVGNFGSHSVDGLGTFQLSLVDQLQSDLQVLQNIVILAAPQKSNPALF